MKGRFIFFIGFVLPYKHTPRANLSDNDEKCYYFPILVGKVLPSSVFIYQSVSTEVQTHERELAALCSRGDEAARRTVYELYSGWILCICRRYMPDTQDAEDLTHDAFMKIFDKIGKFRYSGKGSLKAWMSRLTANMALNRLRDEKKMESLDIADVPEPTEEEAKDIPLDVLVSLISSLPPQRRAVFNMFCIDDWSHAEIAKELGISENASTITLLKARRELAAKIKEWIKDNA